MKTKDQREKEIKELLRQFTECNSRSFDCIDPDLQTDKFEQESPLDFKTIATNQDNSIEFLLKIRAKISIRIKLSEMMLKRLLS